MSGTRSSGMHSKHSSARVGDYPSSDGLVPTSNAAFSTVTANVLEFPDVISLNAGGPKIGETKVTHLNSPDDYHEYVPGFADGDTVTLKLNYSKVNLRMANGLLPAPTAAAPDFGRKLFEYQYPDGLRVRFIAFANGVPQDIPEDDRITIEVPLRVSGPMRVIADPPPPPPPPP